MDKHATLLDKKNVICHLTRVSSASQRNRSKIVIQTHPSMVARVRERIWEWTRDSWVRVKMWWMCCIAEKKAFVKWHPTLGILCANARNVNLSMNSFSRHTFFSSDCSATYWCWILISGCWKEQTHTARSYLFFFGSWKFVLNIQLSFSAIELFLFILFGWISVFLANLRERRKYDVIFQWWCKLNERTREKNDSTVHHLQW